MEGNCLQFNLSYQLNEKYWAYFGKVWINWILIKEIFNLLLWNFIFGAILVTVFFKVEKKPFVGLTYISIKICDKAAS